MIILQNRQKMSPRFRQSLDLRNCPEDMSQRMLNALEPSTIMPIHRHKNSSDVNGSLRGHKILLLRGENFVTTRGTLNLGLRIDIKSDLKSFKKICY